MSNEEMIVKVNEIKVIDESFPLIMNKLVMEDGSQLVIPPSIKNFKLTVSTLIMGKGIIISAQGHNGENATHLSGSADRRRTVGAGVEGDDGSNGQQGTDGTNITIKTSRLEFVSFTFNTSGGNGGFGGNAQGGGKGSNSSCDTHGRRGGHGGDGGDGGRGGNPGTALITFNDFTILPDQNNKYENSPYRWIANGGIGGNKGEGGAAGQGGNSSDCGTWPVKWSMSGGNGGDRGSHGKKGKEGQTIEVNEVSWFRHN